MGLAGASADELARTKSALDAFLSDAAKLAAVRQLLAEGQGVTAEQRHVLAILEKTFKVGRRGAGDRQASACACCQVSWGLRECRHSQQQQLLNKLAWSTLPKLPSGAADLHHGGRAGGAGGAGQGMKSVASPHQGSACPAFSVSSAWASCRCMPCPPHPHPVPCPRSTRSG